MNRSFGMGLGGHSFIEALGSDPLASFEEQCAIVAACLDNGIAVIDTTYYQERVALGRVLEQLGRRDEAHIMAWNFFKPTVESDELPGPTPYEAEHIDIVLEELGTNRIDTLVIHVHNDRCRFGQELELAQEWLSAGKIKRVALGMARAEDLKGLPDKHPVSCVLAPYNAFNLGAEEVFKLARTAGMEVLALSPFIRGWKLEEIGEKENAPGILLRWVAQSPLVDKVIVSMRKQEYVRGNLQILKQGQLSISEQERLVGWVNRFK